MLVSSPACPVGMVRLWVNLSPNWVQLKQVRCTGLHFGACGAVQSW